MDEFKDEDIGLYRKYDVERLDGSSDPGGKHAMCEYFVLDLDHDKFSVPALKAYAEACRIEFPALADDLDTKVRRLEQEFARGIQ